MILKKPPAYLINKLEVIIINSILKLIYFCKLGLIDTSFAGIGLQGNASVKVGDELNAAGSAGDLIAFTSSNVSVLTISYHLVHSPANSQAFSQTISSHVAEVTSTDASGTVGGNPAALLFTWFIALNALASELLPVALI